MFLYFIFVNDCEAVSTSCDILQFADDRAIFCPAKNEAHLHLRAEDAINKTVHYMKQNRLTLDEGTTDLVVFRYE